MRLPCLVPLEVYRRELRRVCRFAVAPGGMGSAEVDAATSPSRSDIAINAAAAKGGPSLRSMADREVRCASGRDRWGIDKQSGLRGAAPRKTAGLPRRRQARLGGKNQKTTQ